MAQKLTELTKAPGVAGAFLLHEKGEVILNEMPSEYKRIKFEGMIPYINEFIRQSTILGDKINLVDIYFEAGRILLRKENAMILGAVCKPQANISLLRMTFNVVLAGVKKDKSIMKHFK